MSWVTPLLIHPASRPEVLFASAQEVTAYDPATGRRLWTFAGAGLFPNPSAPSPAAGDGLVVLAGGVALRPGGDGKPPQVVWKSKRLRPAYASPLYYRGRVYALNNSAVALNCFDGKRGKLLWAQRLRGPFSASPVAADGKLYLVNEDGETAVLEAGDRPRVLARNKLPGTFLATPALAGGALFLRSEKELYCIAGQGGRRR
jgi:outer membrane protein assembly factor BamB